MRIALIALALVSQSSFAKDITCKRPVEDASAVARFVGVGLSKTVVRLSIPAGETQARTYTGGCQSLSGRIGAFYLCNVKVTADSGYVVQLKSSDGSSFAAAYWTWDNSGNGPAHSLPCGK